MKGQFVVYGRLERVVENSDGCFEPHILTKDVLKIPGMFVYDAGEPCGQIISVEIHEGALYFSAALIFECPIGRSCALLGKYDTCRIIPKGILFLSSPFNDDIQRIQSCTPIPNRQKRLCRLIVQK